MTCRAASCFSSNPRTVKIGSSNECQLSGPPTSLKLHSSKSNRGILESFEKFNARWFKVSFDEYERSGKTSGPAVNRQPDYRGRDL